MTEQPKRSYRNTSAALGGSSAPIPKGAIAGTATRKASAGDSGAAKAHGPAKKGAAVTMQIGNTIERELEYLSRKKKQDAEEAILSIKRSPGKTDDERQRQTFVYAILGCAIAAAFLLIFLATVQKEHSQRPQGLVIGPTGAAPTSSMIRPRGNVSTAVPASVFRQSNGAHTAGISYAAQPLSNAYGSYNSPAPRPVAPVSQVQLPEATQQPLPVSTAVQPPVAVQVTPANQASSLQAGSVNQPQSIAVPPVAPSTGAAAPPYMMRGPNQAGGPPTYVQPAPPQTQQVPSNADQSSTNDQSPNN